MRENQISPTPDQPEDHTLSTATDNEKPTLVIVEDNQDMRYYLTSCLNQLYQCSTANDGAAGIELVRETLPDLVISDVMMPIKDGFELTRTLKTDPATSHIPIILLTAHGDEESRLQGWAEQADEFLAKPFNTAQLLARIDNLLSIRSILRQRYQRALTSPTPSNEIVVTTPAPVSEEQLPANVVHQAFYQQIETVLNNNHHNEHFDVNEFAKAMHISSRQLSRKVKALLDMTPNEALRSFRLKKAAQLLRQGKSSGMVAFEVGFSSHSYFTQCFKAQYDCMPSNYLQREQRALKR